MRETGYYWVRLRPGGTWFIAHWSLEHYCWKVAGNNTLFQDSDFAEIGTAITHPSHSTCTN